MRCRSNEHDHSSSEVVVATHNPTARGRRPFHCPKCREINKPENVASYWETYGNIEKARDDVPRTRPCKKCF